MTLDAHDRDRAVAEAERLLGEKPEPPAFYQPEVVVAPDGTYVCPLCCRVQFKRGGPPIREDLRDHFRRARDVGKWDGPLPTGVLQLECELGHRHWTPLVPSGEPGGLSRFRVASVEGEWKPA